MNWIDMQCILVEFKFLHITVRFKVKTFFVEYIYKMLIDFLCTNQSSKKNYTGAWLSVPYYDQQ